MILDHLREAQVDWAEKEENKPTTELPTVETEISASNLSPRAASAGGTKNVLIFKKFDTQSRPP